MEKKKIDWIKVCIAPRLILADYQDTIKKTYDYLFVMEEKDYIDSTGREFYNIGLFKQESWYPIEKGDLKQVLNYIKGQENVSIYDNNKEEDKVKQAYELWRLVEYWFSIWEEIDSETRHYTMKETKERKECEKEIGDIIEKHPELEVLIPHPIQWN